MYWRRRFVRTNIFFYYQYPESLASREVNKVVKWCADDGDGRNNLFDYNIYSEIPSCSDGSFDRRNETIFGTKLTSIHSLFHNQIDVELNWKNWANGSASFLLCLNELAQSHDSIISLNISNIWLNGKFIFIRFFSFSLQTHTYNPM